MNWTNASKKALKFFNKRLLPLAKSAKGKAGYFPKGFDTKASSYFESRPSPRMAREDYETGSAIRNAESLEAALGAFWSARGDNELAALAGPMAGLARKLYAADEQTEEVSPFVYAMY